MFRILFYLLVPSFLMASLGVMASNPDVHEQKSIDLKHIAINLDFDWTKKQAYGNVEITLTVLNKTNTVLLDAGLLSIHSVQLNTGSNLVFQYDGGDRDDGLRIKLDKMYARGQLITLKIAYHTNWINHSDPNNIGGSFGKGLRFQEPTLTTPLKRKQIWSQGEPQSNRYWFPSYDRPDDLRTTEFTAKVEKNLTAISNGRLVSLKENSDGTHTFHYKADTPYPNYLTSFVIGEYTDIKQKYNKTALHTFGYPDEKSAVIATTVRLPDMLRYFEKITGKPYPFSQYTQVVVQDYPFPGMIGQHMTTTISDNMIDDDRTHADFFYLWDGVEAHALASQWFGNLIAPEGWQHTWLSESFSHYMDGLYADYKNSHDEFLLYNYSFDRNTVISDWSNGYRHPIVTERYNNITEYVGDNYTKIRGSLVLRMLRKQLGDDTWFKAIREYVRTYAGKQVNTEDFRSVVEKVSRASYKWFFDQWIYTMGHPVFDIHKEYAAGTNQLMLSIKQIQTPDTNSIYPQASLFKGKIELEIDHKIISLWLEPKIENVFRIDCPQAPKLVHVDFESSWIKEIQFKKTVDELIYQLLNDKDILGRMWSIDELTAHAQDEKTSAEEKNKIKAAFRSIASGKLYWRLRGYAISKLRSISDIPLDSTTVNMLKTIIQTEKSWLKAGAITSLGVTKDSVYTDIYLQALLDESDRVINVSAVALGKTKSSKALDALLKLKDKPSWKSQSLISALNGLKELGDPAGADVALKALEDIKAPRWYLATSVWDYPLAAAETLVALKKTDQAYDMNLDRFRNSLIQNDYNDIFSNVLLLLTLGDPRGIEIIGPLKSKFKDDANAMIAISQYETQFNDLQK